MTDAKPGLTPLPERLEEFRLPLPERAANALCRVSAYRQMSCEALAREYIGRGLREDLSREFDERVLAVAESVLAGRLGSAEAAHEVINEVRAAFAPDPPLPGRSRDAVRATSAGDLRP